MTTSTSPWIRASPWITISSAIATTGHACWPSAMVRGREFVATWSIRAWEEVTFNYKTTEYAIE